MADIGIKISAPGVGIKKAGKSQLFMSTQYPFLKLDTQRATSFESITLLFNHDPPEPSIGSTTDTVVYQYAHGYTYTPRIWSLFQVVIAPVGTGFSQTYFQDSGTIGSMTAADGAIMSATADATNIYINVHKFLSGGGSANNLIGTVMKFTIFTFVDDLSGS